MEGLFVRAVEQAGFRPVRPLALGSDLIHAAIIGSLSDANMVLCDLSAHNPNVFFELGVRTSLNLPITLVCDEFTTLPFDTAGINTHRYDSQLRGWEIEDAISKLADHLRESTTRCDGGNPLWRQFGLALKAQEPSADESPLEARIDLLTDQLARLQQRVESDSLLEASLAARTTDINPVAASVYETRAHNKRDVDAYVRALQGYALERNIAFEYTYRPPRALTIKCGPGWRIRDINRARELAEAFGVKLGVDTGSHNDAETSSRSEAGRLLIEKFLSEEPRLTIDDIPKSKP